MNIWKSKILFSPLRIILFFFFLYSVHYAQTIRFKNLSVNDGLSHNTVTAFCEDRFGYMWVGTSDGLNRFDGVRFTIYRNDPSDSTSISDNSILAIFEDNEGFLWIGTENGGLNRFDPRTESFKAFTHNSDNPKTIGYNSVSSIAGDRFGNLWIGTKKGLNKLPFTEKNKTNPAFINYFAADNSSSITHDVIYSVRIDKKGSIWLSLSNGFGVDKLDFTDSSYTHFKKTNIRNNAKNPNSLSGDWVLYTFEDSKGRIWIASWNAGLNKFEPSKAKFTNFKNDPDNKESIGSNYIEMITEDDAGNIWVATYDGGLNKFVEEEQGKPEHFINYKFDNLNPNSLPDNRAVILYKDRSGIIWIGTSGHGLSRFAPHSRFFNIYLKSGNEKANYKPSAIIKTSDGKLWVGTYEGELFRLNKDGKILNSYKLPVYDKPTRNFPVISSLCEDEFNTLWIATSRSGLFYIDKTTIGTPSPQIVHVEPFRISPPLSYPNGYQLVRETPDKRLLIGTYNGQGAFVFPREEKQNKRLVNFKTIGFPFAWSYEKGDNSFWMGSFYNGICNIALPDFQIKTHFNYMPLNPKDKNSLPHGDVYTILNSKDNLIWFGTLKSLSMLNPAAGTMTHFSSKDGLANESVYGLLEDYNGNIWISTYNGLSKLDPKTMLFTNFYSEDGIQANEFNQFSYYKDKEGLLYFGGISGITVIDPRMDMSKISFPKIKFTGLYILNAKQQINSLIREGILSSSFNYSNEIMLPYDKDAFTIEFSALELESPQKIKYKYKLEGYNEEWVQLRPAQHSVSFMNLGHKSYILKLMSTNKDGLWNPEIAELKITITPPFYNTFWFRFLAIIIIAGLIVFIFKYRAKRSIQRQNELLNLVNEKTAELKERNADLESFSYSVSHDLRTPLRSIYSFSQIINEDYGHQLSDEAKIYFQKITNAAINMTNLIDGILKMAQIARSEINRKSVNLSEIAEHIIDNHRHEFPDKTISASIEPELFVYGDLVLLTTVLENLISNAVKFSMNNEIIQIEFGKTRAFDRTKSSAAEVFYIKDNGTGFDMKYSEKLFQVFQRLHSMGEFSGTGIGLANVNKIITRHGGVIWAESEPDKGAAFFFYIPE